MFSHIIQLRNERIPKGENKEELKGVDQPNQ